MKQILIALAILLITVPAYATQISYSKTFSDGEVLTASDLETMKSDISGVVNAGGGPVGLTNSQTVSGAKTFGSTVVVEGATTINDDLTITGDQTISGSFLGATAFRLGGATEDAYEVTVSVTDPTADRTLTIPNEDVNLSDFADWRPKAWASISLAGEDSINDDYGVASVATGGAGAVVITWDTAFADTNYAVVSMGKLAHMIVVTAIATDTITLQCYTSDGPGNPSDDTNLMIAAFGNQ